jgi:pheromone shutdown protein TraB
MILSFTKTMILSFTKTVILSFTKTVILSFTKTVILSFTKTMILSFTKTVILSFTKTVILSADVLSEAGSKKMATLTNTATAGVQPLEALLTAGVVGKLEQEGTMLARRMQEDMAKDAQVQREVTACRDCTK